jgi:hypothetical protein
MLNMTNEKKVKSGSNATYSIIPAHFVNTRLERGLIIAVHTLARLEHGQTTITLATIDWRSARTATIYVNQSRNAQLVDKHSRRVAVVEDERQSEPIRTCEVGRVVLDRAEQRLVRVVRVVEVGLDVPVHTEHSIVSQ